MRPPCVLLLATVVASPFPAAAVTAVATLRCAPGCEADLEFVTITKNGVPVGEIASLGCGPGQQTASTTVELAASGPNDLHVRAFFVKCPDTDTETDTCDVEIPANQEPWGVEFTVDNQGAGCNAIGQSPGFGAWRPAARAASPLGEGVAVALTVDDDPCVPSATRLCIDDVPGDRRFAVEVAYQTTSAGGLAGEGQAKSLAPLGVTQGGVFSFFDPKNPELFIKILDGCGVNQHYWVFWSAGTNVGMDIDVTDTLAGESKEYLNPDQRAAPPVQDTSAFDCVP
jgi:hypothetical protein